MRQAKSVLVSGASIAGLTLAFWLHRYGFEVTVVERAASIRSGGYPIDVRGTAVDVIERMNLLSQLQSAHIDSRALMFVDAGGRVIGTLPPNDTALGRRHDIELPRGTLTSMLYEASRQSAARYRFNDSIAALNDDGAGVDIRFTSGERERYDVVIAADGLHSHTRDLVFGPEDSFQFYLGYCVNVFSMPNDLGVSHGGKVYAVPGRSAGAWAVGDGKSVYALLVFSTDDPPRGEHRDAAAQYRRTAAAFAEGGWEIPRMLEAMSKADDLYYDSVSQVRMSRWSSGRVALVGDAAFAPSFLTGQGTSLALVGAYVLAGELASHDDPSKAFAAYESVARPFMEANQALASKDKGSYFVPRTQAEVEARNEMLSAVASGHKRGGSANAARDVFSALRLSDYGEAHA